MPGQFAPPTVDLSRAEFVLSAMAAHQLPLGGRELAFAGRSNVGKSSALNALTRPGLARTSKTPGRTQALNVFSVGPGRHLIDLPGYGYARAPRDLKDEWSRLRDSYLAYRNELHALVLLVDIRRGLGPMDLGLLALVDTRRLALRIVLTKADTLSRALQQDALRKTLQQRPAASVQLFASRTHIGVDELVRWVVSALTL